MACAICGTGRPRRYCPGVRGDICTVCCGTERENTVSCPLDCEFLVEARRHEKAPEIDPEQIPNRDIRVSEKFLEEHEPLLAFLGQTMLGAALDGAGVVDSDVREALVALIRTYRTLESGVYYETVPANPLAAGVHQAVQKGVEHFRREERQQLGISELATRTCWGAWPSSNAWPSTRTTGGGAAGRFWARWRISTADRPRPGLRRPRCFFPESPGGGAARSGRRACAPCWPGGRCICARR